MKLLVILFILKLYAEETFLLPHDFSPFLTNKILLLESNDIVDVIM